MADEPDECFGNPRLAEIYDALDPDRGDLDPYLRMAEGVGARRVLDIGCGTGVLALLLADLGIEVVGVDPAGASSTWPGASRAPSGCAGSAVTRRHFRRSGWTWRRARVHSQTRL